MKPSFAKIATEAELRQIYGDASALIRDKAMPALDGHARAFLGLSPFFCVGTGGAAADVSPRGGEPGFVHILDDRTLAFPDRPGNNRLDTLVNLLREPAVGLLFFIPGFEEMLRVNGNAYLTVDEGLMASFIEKGRRPRAVTVVDVQEVYLHCTKAIKRSSLWDPTAQVPRATLPSFGQMLREQYKVQASATAIDADLAKDAADNLY